MKKAIMNTMIILFALAMCVGCGQSSEQKEESVPTRCNKGRKTRASTGGSGGRRYAGKWRAGI